MRTRYLRRVAVDVAGLRIENLRIEFNVQLDLGVANPGSVVKIWNLSNDTAVQIQSKGEELSLYVGYRGLGAEAAAAQLELLYQGEVRTVDHEVEPSGIDRVTTITLGGSDSKRMAETSRSYDGVVELSDLVETIVSADMQLDVGSTDVLPADKLLDWAWSGKAAEALTSLLDPRGIDWYDFNGEVRFSARGQPGDGDEVELNKFTGLIGSPSKTEKGAKARALLDQTIELTDPVRLESLQVSGQFKVIRLVHSGNSWDGRNETQIEMVSAA